MFFESRLKILEDAFKKHSQNEEKVVDTLLETLVSIRDEIHKTNESIIESNAATKISLVETKNELLNTIFDKFVLKEEHEDYENNTRKELDTLKKSLEGKVDKSSVKLTYTIIGSITAFIVWILEWWE